jgi:hypothetical protein
MEKTIEINDKVVFTAQGRINGLTGVVENITETGYLVRLDNSPLKFFNLISAKKDEVNLVMSN